MTVINYYRYCTSRVWACVHFFRVIQLCHIQLYLFAQRLIKDMVVGSLKYTQQLSFCLQFTLKSAICCFALSHGCITLQPMQIYLVKVTKNTRSWYFKRKRSACIRSFYVDKLISVPLKCSGSWYLFESIRFIYAYYQYLFELFANVTVEKKKEHS